MKNSIIRFLGTRHWGKSEDEDRDYSRRARDCRGRGETRWLRSGSRARDLRAINRSLAFRSYRGTSLKRNCPVIDTIQQNLATRAPSAKRNAVECNGKDSYKLRRTRASCYIGGGGGGRGGR